MQDREKLTGEELEQAFQEGIDYLRGLMGETHKVVLKSGKEGEMSVSYPGMGEHQILIKFPTGREAYRINDFEGLKEIHIPATDTIPTEVLGDVSPFPCGWLEFKTDLGRLSLDYQNHKRGQKLLALKVIDRLRAGIKQ